MVLVESYFPNDQVTIRWVHFHSFFFFDDFSSLSFVWAGVSLTDSGSGELI